LSQEAQIIVVGAGLSGLSCARELKRLQREPRVIERSSSVGGRIATKHLGENLFDYGPVFFHGRDASFVNSLMSQKPESNLVGWPQRVRGSGSPCQPDSFEENQTRWAVRGGLRSAVQSLAEGFEIEFGQQVDELVLEEDGWLLRSNSGQSWKTPTLILTLAHEQNLKLLQGVNHPTINNLVEGMGFHSSLTCLTLAAFYDHVPEELDWDIWYPEGSHFTLISNETSKHGGVGQIIVFQAKPVWSRNRMDLDPQIWSNEILDEARTLLGAWAAQPAEVYPHRWRYARMDASSFLPRPLLIQVNHFWLGIAGDLYHPNRGLEASWLSGQKLAQDVVAASNAS